MTEPALSSRLRRRIIIQQPVETSDEMGGFTITWQNFATVWAELTPKSGSDSFQDERIVSNKKVNVVVRYLNGVTDKMRIQYGARFFNIVAILNPYEENVLLEILAEEVS